MRTVRNDIDLVLALAAIDAFAKLYAVSLDARVSPEARLHAGELVRVAAAEGDAPAGLDFGRMDRVLAALVRSGRRASYVLLQQGRHEAAWFQSVRGPEARQVGARMRRGGGPTAPHGAAGSAPHQAAAMVPLRLTARRVVLLAHKVFRTDPGLPH